MAGIYSRGMAGKYLRWREYNQEAWQENIQDGGNIFKLAGIK